MKRLLVAALAVCTPLVGSVAATAQSQPAPLRPYALRLDVGTKTATAVAGAAALNKSSGKITSEALVTAAAATYVLTLTNSTIEAADQVYASVSLGTATTGLPDITSIKVNAGSVVITVQNAAPATALNGTIIISFMVLKA